MHVGIERGLRAFPPERHAAGEHAIGHNGQTVEIAAPVHTFPLCLLRRHIFRRAHHRAGVGQAGNAGGAGDAEIGQQGVAGVAHQDVAGLDVTVHDPAAVRVIQRRRHLADHAEREIERQRPAHALHDLSQRLPLHIFDGDVVDAIDLAGIVQGHDVGMIEPGRGAGLVQKTGHKPRVPLQILVQDLQRHRPLQSLVIGQIDHSHAPAAKLALDAVGAYEIAGSQHGGRSAGGDARPRQGPAAQPLARSMRSCNSAMISAFSGCRAARSARS